MKTRAAVLHNVGEPMQIEDLDVSAPGDHEVLVRYQYAGMCRSDLHVIDGTIAGWLPMVLGHEGAGIVEAAGRAVTRVKPRDHIVCSFIPSCGTCRWCASGQQVLCDTGAATMRGYLPGEHWPLQGPAGRYGAMCQVGTFSEYGVIHETSAVRIDDDLPLDCAAIVGCGVPTGWGSAVNAADVRPGETVVVFGAGGIGMNAVQGAAMAGAGRVIAVEPVEFKRELARDFGATHVAAHSAEAQSLIMQLTRGVGADKVIVTASSMTPELSLEAFNACSKGGTIVITAMAPFGDNTITVPSGVLTMWKKTIRGTAYGDCNPTADIPRLLAMYRNGNLKLDELITGRYTLDQINDGYEDLDNGKLLRGVIELG